MCNILADSSSSGDPPKTARFPSLTPESVFFDHTLRGGKWYRNKSRKRKKKRKRGLICLFTGRSGSRWWSQSPCCGWSPRPGSRSPRWWRPSGGRGRSQLRPRVPCAQGRALAWWEGSARLRPFLLRLLPPQEPAGPHPGTQGCSRPSF